MALSSSSKSDSDPSFNSQSSAIFDSYDPVDQFPIRFFPRMDSYDSDDSSDFDDQLPFFPLFEDLEAENIVEAEFSPELDDQDSSDFCRNHGSVMRPPTSNLPETTPSPNPRNNLDQDESFAFSMSMDLTSIVQGTLGEYSMSSHVTMSMLTLSCLSQRHCFGQPLTHQWTRIIY